MIATIKGEVKRHGRNKTMWLLLLVMICVHILVAIAQNSIFAGEQIPGIVKPYLRTFVWFSSMSGIFSILYGTVIGYRFLSTEYREGTWELLFLTIKDKRKVIFSKYILYVACLFLVKIISLLMYFLIMATYYSLNPFHSDMIPFLLVYFGGDFFLEACVFVLLLKISHGALAIGLSFLFILISSLFRGGAVWGKYIPLLFPLWFYNLGLQKPVWLLFLLCGWNVVAGVVFIALIQKQFHL